MKRATPAVCKYAALAAILALVLTAPVVRAQGAQCSDATMRGTYVMTSMGTIVGVGPVASVGIVIYDGQGHGQGVVTQSVNGVVYRKITITGTFTVNSDCSGSKSFAGGTINFDFVITPDGQTITFIDSDTGVVLTGTATRMPRGWFN